MYRFFVSFLIALNISSICKPICYAMDGASVSIVSLIATYMLVKSGSAHYTATLESLHTTYIAPFQELYARIRALPVQWYLDPLNGNYPLLRYDN